MKKRYSLILCPFIGFALGYFNFPVLFFSFILLASVYFFIKISSSKIKIFDTHLIKEKKFRNWAEFELFEKQIIEQISIQRKSLNVILIHLSFQIESLRLQQTESILDRDYDKKNKFSSARAENEIIEIRQEMQVVKEKSEDENEMILNALQKKELEYAGVILLRQIHLHFKKENS